MWKLELDLCEPFTCADRPWVSNEVGTLEYVPCTNLRGALAAALARQGREGDLEPWFGGALPRWSPAWPVAQGDGHVVPMPLSFLREKRDAGFGGQYGIWNTLETDPPAEDHEERMQWVRAGQRWLHVGKDGEPAGVWTVNTSTDMHVALHYERQSNRSGALFSRSAVAQGQKFVAYVRDGGKALAGWPAELLLGKRRSAGNGAASLRASECGEPVWPPTKNTPGGEARIQLMTDAIVPGHNGGLLRGLDGAAFSEILKVKVSVVRAAAAWREVAGWSGTWGLPREQAVAVAAGSVYRLRCQGDTGCSVRSCWTSSATA